MSSKIKYNIDTINKIKLGTFRYRIEIWGWAFDQHLNPVMIKNANHFTYAFTNERIKNPSLVADHGLNDLLKYGFIISFNAFVNLKEITIIMTDSGNAESVRPKLTLPEALLIKTKPGFIEKSRAIITSEGYFPYFKKVTHKGFTLAKDTLFSIQYTLRLMPESRPSAKRALPEDSSSEYIAKSEQPFQGKAPARLICFYLPQYHTIPENDTWWGEGFTEWTFVKAAKPLFRGHAQPRKPDSLGYYNLLDYSVQKKQVELAQHYGISGFCFYYYWFAGKTLLEKPVENYLQDKTLDLPFCLCWANENWTRRWDGLGNEILIAQQHSPQDDLAFISHIKKYLADSRYIRVNNKPLLLVYRPGLLPDAKQTADRWRNWCLNNGIGEIYLAYTQSFEAVPPEKYGFDAAIEFPPNLLFSAIKNKQVDIIHEKQACSIYDWQSFLINSRVYQKPEYRLHRGICPAWDNTPRRGRRGTVFANSSPQGYQEWLYNAIIDTEVRFEEDERLIFINAWNEWAEGAYLEPDQANGYAYLQATADALKKVKSSRINKKIVYVCHDAHFHGAQLLSLNIVKWLTECLQYEVHLILLAGGELEKDFEKYASVYNLERDYREPKKLQELILSLKKLGLDSAICNTVLSGKLLRLLSDQGFKTICLVHELPGVISSYDAEAHARLIAAYADYVVFAADYVGSKFTNLTNLSPSKKMIVPQGLYKENRNKDNLPLARVNLRKKFNLPSDAKIVLTVGYGDHRKGLDLFIEVATEIIKNNENCYFLWAGSKDEKLFKELKKKDHLLSAAQHIIFFEPGYNTDLFYAGSDLYLLTSREDPFPSVVLEAMDAELPVVAFNDAGGFSEVITAENGLLVPYLNIEEMVNAVQRLLANDSLRNTLGLNAKAVVEAGFKLSDYIYKLLALLGHSYRKVSVIIPNYNYAHYLEGRLKSICDQSYPIYEIIVLDDCSTDHSLAELQRLKERLNLNNISVIKNNANAGSVYGQWRKGIALAGGDFTWIAEVDDLSENSFLEEVMQAFEDEQAVLSYSQSKQLNEYGQVLADNYLAYTDDVDLQQWKNSYIREGVKEITDSLAVKNTIPNISAVVFRKKTLQAAISIDCAYKIACDWFLYLRVLEKGKISYCVKPLNLHRRHTASITGQYENKKHYQEIVDMQEYISTQYLISETVRNKVLAYRKKIHAYLLG